MAALLDSRRCRRWERFRRYRTEARICPSFCHYDPRR